MEEQYDSSTETLLHIKKVSKLLMQACQMLMTRAMNHDKSKLYEPEKSYFDKYTPELRGLVYGTEEYEQSKLKLKPALDHHYAKNSHHPEHYENGIDGMNLFDVVEMFFDWRASSDRQDTGNICRSMKKLQENYEMSDQLTSIFNNTVKHMGW